MSGRARFWGMLLGVLALVALWPGVAEAQQCREVDGACIPCCPGGKAPGPPPACMCPSTPPPPPPVVPGGGCRPRNCGPNARWVQNQCRCVAVNRPPPPPQGCRIPESSCGTCEELKNPGSPSCRCGLKPSYKLNACYDRECTPNNTFACRQLWKRTKSMKCSQGKNYFQKACRGNVKEACDKYVKTCGGKEDPDASERICRSSSSKSTMSTCTDAGDAYRRQRDYPKARAVYRYGCYTRNYYYACGKYGDMLRYGEGGRRDRSGAKAAYRKGCLGNTYNKWTCNKLGNAELFDRQKKKAEAAFTRACNTTQPKYSPIETCESLADIKKSYGKHTDAKKYYKIACKDGKFGGRGGACLKYAGYYDKRAPGQSSSLKTAAVYYKYACKRYRKDGCRKADEIKKLLSDDDYDGVPNIDDKCLNEKEDKDGYKDGDGCRDEDNDGDGIKDENDKCRDIAETKNNIEDEDGCPEGRLKLTVRCDGDDVDDPTLKVDGVTRKLGEAIWLTKGRHTIEAESFWCSPSTISVNYKPGKGDVSKTIYLRGGTPQAKPRGWELSTGFNGMFLPAGGTLSFENPGGGVVLGDGGATLMGANLRAGLAWDNFVVGLDFGVAKASDVPIQSYLGQGATPSAVNITAWQFPGLYVGARFPFLWFAASGGVSFNMTHYQIENVSEDERNQVGINAPTLLDFGVWGGLDVKPLCDLGIQGRGGYKFGIGPDNEVGLNHPFVNANLILQACRDDAALDERAAVLDEDEAFTIALAWQHAILPRNPRLGGAEGQGGTVLAGNTALNGLSLSFHRNFGDLFYAGVEMAFARGTGFTVAQYTLGDEDEQPVDENGQNCQNAGSQCFADVTVWNVPNGRFGLRVPLWHIALDAGTSFGLTAMVPSVQDADVDDLNQFDLGFHGGVEFKPWCEFGALMRAGHKFGLAIDENSINYSYVQAGLEYQPCD